MDWRCVLCLQSLHFTVNRVLMKLFTSSNTAVIEQCRYFFHIKVPSVQPQRRFEKFFWQMLLMMIRFISA